MKKKFLLLLTLTLTALTGAEAKPIPQQPKTGTVIVYRKPTAGSYLSWNPLTGLFGSALAGAISAQIPIPLYVNGQLACNLRYNRYYKLELPPGDYSFTQTRGQKNWFADRRAVHVAAGQTLYFGYFVGAYHTAFGVAEDQNEARQAVSKLKPQN